MAEMRAVSVDEPLAARALIIAMRLTEADEVADLIAIAREIVRFVEEVGQDPGWPENAALDVIRARLGQCHDDLLLAIARTTEVVRALSSSLEAAPQGLPE